MDPGEGPQLPAEVTYPRIDVPTGELSLAGPSACGDRARLPVRGDLAHVRLAGQCFVPHYAVPMPHAVAARGAVLRDAGRAGADPLAALDAGTPFAVLDLAGGWAWGQVGDDGLVGYITADALDPL